MSDNGTEEVPATLRSMEVQDIEELKRQGMSVSGIAQVTGFDRKTIRKYIAPAVAAGMAPGGPVVTQAQWAELVLGWFPGLQDTSLRQVTWPEIAVHRDFVVAHLKVGVTQATIHQRLRDSARIDAEGAQTPVTFR